MDDWELPQLCRWDQNKSWKVVADDPWSGNESSLKWYILVIREENKFVYYWG